MVSYRSLLYNTLVLYDKSLIPIFGSLAIVRTYMPKEGIKLLLISFLLPESFLLASARILFLVSLHFVAV